MTPTVTRRTRWRLALSGLALALATSGCSQVIAHIGVSSVSEIYRPQTRAEVREAFGDADETGTCPDGRPAERRAIRQASCPGFKCVRSGGTDTSLVFDPLLVPFAVYWSERDKLHYAFVYGADDRVVYRYDLRADPATRFSQAVHPIDSVNLIWPLCDALIWPHPHHRFSARRP